MIAQCLKALHALTEGAMQSIDPDNYTVKISIKWIAIKKLMRILVICAYIYEKLKDHMTLACYLIA